MSEQVENQNAEIRIHELEERINCVNGHSFIAKNAQLIPFIAHTENLGKVLHVSHHEYGIYIGGGSEKEPTTGYLVSCPECGLVHLTGFPPAPSEAELLEGVDNTPPKRLLTVS